MSSIYVKTPSETKAIQDLNVKAGNLAATDMLPINQDDGGGNFSAKCITGQQIIDAVPTGGIDLDYSSITSAIKADLTQSSQPQYGAAVTIRANGSLLNGQPVIWNYASGTATAITAGALPTQQIALGICLENISNGNTGKVLVNGFATARRTTIYTPNEETVQLTEETNGAMYGLTNNTTFTDNNLGSGGDYSNGQNYQITFDAGAGYTTNVTVNDFAFEHTSTRMYDRLGIQVSNDNVEYIDYQIPWGQRSNDDTPPYSSYFFENASWNSAGSSPGPILPENTPRAILLGASGFPNVLNTAHRYVRFYFLSDGSAGELGWDMTLQPNIPYSSPAETLAVGSTLYLSNSYPSQLLTETDTSQVRFGYNIYENTENDSILMRVQPPRS